MDVNKMIELIEKYKVENKDKPYGIICSEMTFNLLRKAYENVSDKRTQSLLNTYGLKIRSEKYFPDDIVWILSKEKFELVEKHGLAYLIYIMALSKKSDGGNDEKV